MHNKLVTQILFSVAFRFVIIFITDLNVKFIWYVLLLFLFIYYFLFYYCRMLTTYLVQFLRGH